MIAGTEKLVEDNARPYETESSNHGSDTNMVARSEVTNCGEGPDIRVQLNSIESKLDRLLKREAGGRGSAITRAVSVTPVDDEAKTLEEAIEQKIWIRGKCTKFFTEKGFGFALVRGQEIFMHATSIDGSSDDIIGSNVVVQVIRDNAHGSNSYKATKTRKESRHIEIISAELT